MNLFRFFVFLVFIFFPSVLRSWKLSFIYFSFFHFIQFLFILFTQFSVFPSISLFLFLSLDFCVSFLHLFPLPQSQAFHSLPSLRLCFSPSIFSLFASSPFPPRLSVTPSLLSFFRVATTASSVLYILPLSARQYPSEANE